LLSRGGEFGGVRFIEFDLVDNADDCGVHRAIPAFSGHAGGAASDYEHFFAESGADGVHGD
jgi:hypothetical protein